ncbi:MAG: pirin family protein [Acidisphaera sp.]|nr:pirin family protein [Acidisphaera sp.]MBV9813505.1 pirin family protein [Acetobacteraceae bacterium]
MIDVRPFARLGSFENEWLKARHHFSFGQYRDPSRMGVGALRVWNDDEIAPGKGFDPHPHADMEIITFVREGAITHRDSLGNEGRTEAGDVQVMHAGTGIVHAEYNLEATPTRIFQIWITPRAPGVTPGWGTRAFPKETAGELQVLADGRADADGSALPLYADGAVLAGTVKAGATVRQRLRPGRAAYLVAATGSVRINGVPVGTRDGAAIADEIDIAVSADADAQIVLVDVAA